MPRGRAVASVPGSTPESHARPSTRKLRILIADDNRDAAQTLAIMLAYDGHEVRTAYDGLEALATGQVFEPDVVLLDIGMPVMDGHQTARQIRERPWGRDVYLVALTGRVRMKIDEAARARLQHHLVEPALAREDRCRSRARASLPTRPPRHRYIDCGAPGTPDVRSSRHALSRQ